jgi:hypothetical protein
MERQGSGISKLAHCLIGFNGRAPRHVVYTLARSLCHRHARASALTSMPTASGFFADTSALPSAATIRLQPPHWKFLPSAEQT